MQSSTPASEGAVEAELHVRSLSPAAARERQTTVLDRLQTLHERDAIDDLRVSVWGDRVGLDPAAARTDAAAAVHARLDAFRTWASDEDRTIDPFFETREAESSVTGGTAAALVLPMMVLAEYRDGTLVHVAPHATDEEICTVPDRLAALERATGRRRIA